MAENHPRLFKYSPVEMRSLVESNRLRLADLGMLLKGLRSLRDRKLAHLDRKQLNDPASVSPEPIQSQNLSHCVDILTMILSDLWQAFYGVTTSRRSRGFFDLEGIGNSMVMIVGKSVEMMGHSE